MYGFHLNVFKFCTSNFTFNKSCYPAKAMYVGVLRTEQAVWKLPL